MVPQGSEVVQVHIDCDACRVRGPGCGDCVVTVLLGAPPDGVDLDAEERAAIGVLAGAGLVPPLRLVTGGRRRPAAAPGEEAAASG